jgi:hypothetical protein
MPNGHNPDKPTPAPGSGSGTGTGTGTGTGSGNGTGTGTGGVKPQDTHKPPQLRLLVAAGIGGLVGGAAGALIGCCCLHH